MEVYKKRVEKCAKYRDLAKDIKKHFTKQNPNAEKVTFESV